eukprot:3466756-Pleurochrysis_carterae.AAC.2
MATTSPVTTAAAKTDLDCKTVAHSHGHATPGYFMKVSMQHTISQPACHDLRFQFMHSKCNPLVENSQRRCGSKDAAKANDWPVFIDSTRQHLASNSESCTAALQSPEDWAEVLGAGSAAIARTFPQGYKRVPNHQYYRGA